MDGDEDAGNVPGARTGDGDEDVWRKAGGDTLVRRPGCGGKLVSLTAWAYLAGHAPHPKLPRVEHQQNGGSPDTRCLYAWLSRDADGIEGLIATPMPGGVIMPLVMADEALALRMEPRAREAAALRRAPAVLVRFTRDVVLREIKP